MPRFSKILLSFSVLFLLASCEGYRMAHGTVMDSVTKQPLDSVYCFCFTADRGMYTDTTGYYEASNYMGSCVPRCRDIVIRFSKAGYKNLELVNPTDTLVYMEKQ